MRLRDHHHLLLTAGQKLRRNREPIAQFRERFPAPPRFRGRLRAACASVPRRRDCRAPTGRSEPDGPQAPERRHAAARRRAIVPSSCMPSQEISPRSAGKMPAMVSTSVDLPAPLAPNSAVISPGATLIETSRSTGRPPRATKRLLYRQFRSGHRSTRVPDKRGVRPDRRAPRGLAPWRGACRNPAPTSRRRPRR